MDIETFVKLAKQYNDLGWAIQEQLNDVLQGDVDSVNPNALAYIKRFIDEAANSGVDTEIAECVIRDFEDECQEHAAELEHAAGAFSAL